MFVYSHACHVIVYEALCYEVVNLVVTLSEPYTPALEVVMLVNRSLAAIANDLNGAHVVVSPY